MDLTDIYPKYCITATECTIFSEASEIFSKTDHILHPKTSLTHEKKVKIISYVLSDCGGIKLEMNSKKNNRSYANIWSLTNTPLRD